MKSKHQEKICEILRQVGNPNVTVQDIIKDFEQLIEKAEDDATQHIKDQLKKAIQS